MRTKISKNNLDIKNTGNFITNLIPAGASSIVFYCSHQVRDSNKQTICFWIYGWFCSYVFYLT